MNKVPKKMLIVKNRAFGDAVIGLSSIQYIKIAFPQIEVHYAVPDWVAPLFKHVEHSADRILGLSFTGLANYWRSWKEIKKQRYDVVCELQQREGSARLLNLMQKLGSFEYFYHNHHQRLGENHNVIDQGVRKPIIQRDLDGVYSMLKTFFPTAPYPSYLDIPPQLIVKREDQKKKTYVLGVVATRTEKAWPLESYIELMNLLSKKEDCEFWIPLSHSSDDKRIRSRLMELLSREENPPNVQVIREPLDQLPLVLAQAQFYIGNDTGLKHLCLALGLKTVTLFGPEEPVEWHPYDYQQHPFFWIHGYDVRSQMTQVCWLEQFDRSKHLKEISPLEVLQHLP